MLKKLIAVTLCAFAVHTASAQLVKVSLGMRGEGVATLTGTEIAPSSYVQLGGGGGLFAGIKIGKVIGLQVDGLYHYHLADYPLDIPEFSSVSTRHQYIDIPVCLQLWCSRGFAFEVGYQQSIAFSGIMTLAGEAGPQTIDDTGILDYGSLVAGMIINMGRVVFLNLRYTKALENSYVMSLDPSRNMTVSVGLGFRLFNSRQSVFTK